MQNNISASTTETKEITFTEQERKAIEAALNKQPASLVLLGILAARGIPLDNCRWDFTPIAGAKKVG